MRHTGDDRHGWRLCAMIVVLWRGRSAREELTLAEHDLDHRRGSILVRNGKGGRRREVGVDEWGWEELRPWLSARAEPAAGPARVGTTPQWESRDAFDRFREERLLPTIRELAENEPPPSAEPDVDPVHRLVTR